MLLRGASLLLVGSLEAVQDGDGAGGPLGIGAQLVGHEAGEDGGQRLGGGGGGGGVHGNRVFGRIRDRFNGIFLFLSGLDPLTGGRSAPTLKVLGGILYGCLLRLRLGPLPLAATSVRCTYPREGRSTPLRCHSGGLRGVPVRAAHCHPAARSGVGTRPKTRVKPSQHL